MVGSTAKQRPGGALPPLDAEPNQPCRESDSWLPTKPSDELDVPESGPATCTAALAPDKRPRPNRCPWPGPPRLGSGFKPASITCDRPGLFPIPKRSSAEGEERT